MDSIGGEVEDEINATAEVTDTIVFVSLLVFLVLLLTVIVIFVVVVYHRQSFNISFVASF